MKRSRGSAASVAGIVIISVVCSAVLIVGADYLLLPSLYPSLNGKTSNSPQPQLQKVNQTFYEQWTNYAILYDSNLSYIQMNQTSVLFTVKNANAYIYALFIVPLQLVLDATFTGHIYFKISLVVKGVGNITAPIIYTDYNSAATVRQFSYPITLQFMTGPVAAGIYNISIQWKSNTDATGFNYLDAGDRSGIPYQYTRTLFIEEITA